jgi:sialate O-acetylesterase
MTKKILCVLLSVLVCSSYLSYIPVKASNNSSLLYGDVNQDETVDVKDLVRLKSNILNSKDYVEEGDLDKDTDNDSNDVTLLRKMLVGSFAGIDEITIVGHDVLGDWADDEIAPDGTEETYGPSLCYDNNEETRWNPKANSYNDNVGIEFTLDGYYDMRTLELVCGGREYYFDVYTSTYGDAWDKIISITSENYNDYYMTNAEENYVCILKDLLSEDVHYVKVLVKGNTESNNLWWQFKEISMYGLKQDVPVAEIPIETHEVSGWQTDNANSTSLGPQISYDGSYDVSKWWQAQAALNWANSPSIIYELDGYYDLSEVVIDVIKRAYYFDLYVSSDGNNWKKSLSVTSDNYSTCYTELDGSTYATSDTAKRCKHAFADAEAVKYVKLTMTGSIKNTLYYGLVEIDVKGTKVKAPTMELEIIANEVSSTGWSNARVNDANYAPEFSYDGSLDKWWNPEATDTSYSNDPSIVYTLKSVYDLDKIQITTGKRAYYFDLYVSEDGTGWTKELSITSEERSSYYKNADGTAYTTDETNKLCTIAFPEIIRAKHIKIVFTGAAANTNFVVVKEVEVYGKDLHEDFSFSVSGAFSSNMVLQRDEEISVWGWGNEGETISVTFAGETRTATVDNAGTWEVTFPEQSTNTNGQEMTIMSSLGKKLIFEDILIGDVYLVSGQSNAELSLNRTIAHLSTDEQVTLKEQFNNDNNIRIFTQQKSYVVNNLGYASTPQKDVINEAWQWEIGSVNDACMKFSAMGYYFAKTLRDSLGENIPIGMIQMAAGGAHIEELLPSDVANDLGYTSKITVPVGGYYNSLIHPFVGLPVSGMLFYQGESDSASDQHSANYLRDLTEFIAALRTRWGWEFPVYNVQLSSYGELEAVTNNNWPYLPRVRNAQYQGLHSISNYYLAVSMDVGYNGETDLSGLRDYMHPKNKKTVGERLAKLALAKKYNILSEESAFSPMPVNIEWHETSIILTFENVDDGLALQADTGTSLLGFQCIVNGNIQDVSATITSSNTVKIEMDTTNVTAVRYGMTRLAYPQDANLCDSNGLPTPAFEIEVSN